MANPKRNDRNADMGDMSDMPEQNTDATTGAEGIEDPSMEAGRQQGRELMDEATDFGGQGGQREGSPDPEGTGYTGNSGNMSGSSREGSARDAQRTSRGRTQGDGDGSTTDDSDSENPMA
jgi:hypothetical protein